MQGQKCKWNILKVKAGLLDLLQRETWLQKLSVCLNPLANCRYNSLINLLCNYLRRWNGHKSNRFSLESEIKMKCLNAVFSISVSILEYPSYPRFMRSTCRDTPAGTMSRDRNVQWTSPGCGHAHGRGQPRALLASAASVNRVSTRATQWPIFSFSFSFTAAAKTFIMKKQKTLWSTTIIIKTETQSDVQKKNNEMHCVK